MYKEYYHNGKSLEEWAKEFKGEYSLGELYRMAKDGADLQKILLQSKFIINEG